MKRHALVSSQRSAVSSQQAAACGQRLRLACLLVFLGLSLAPAGARAELTFHLAVTASLTLSHNPIHPGEPLTLTGRVQDLSGAPVTAGLVQLQLADAPEGPWMVLDQGAPDDQGDFQVVDYTLGLETRPFYVRACYQGADGGRVSYGDAVSPVIPVIIRPGRASQDGLSLGFVKAKGDGGPGRMGTGPWEFVVKVKAWQDVNGVMLQGSTADWTLLNGATWDFQADTGRVAARVLEDEQGETLISWQLGFLAAGQEATLKILVDGIMTAGTEGEGDSALPLGGAGVMSFSVVDLAAAGEGREWDKIPSPEPLGAKEE